jgi:spermidine/putrescine transport system substrate-binding protein
MTKFLLTATLAFGLSAATFLTPAHSAEDLNLLTWCDHTDAALLAPFEKANDVKINVKVYELTGAAISLLEQSQPGDWDVFVVDSADVLRFAKQGKLEPLNKADFPYDDFFEGAKLPHLHEADGKLWGVPEKFGFNTIAYDNRAIGKDGKVALKDLFTPEMTGKVAVYDYYLPVIKSLALMKGIKPNDFTEQDLEAIKPELFALKKQAKVVGDLTTTQNALTSGDSVVLLGAAEWAMSVKKELPHIDWTIQSEGGLRWSQSVSIFADSKKKDLSLKLAKYLVSPEGQGAVATASCYWAMPVSKKAVLSDEQKDLMQFDKIDSFLANSYDYGAVSEDLDKKMNEVWTEFLAQ